MSKKCVNEVDSADGVRVGQEPVPGMRLRCICRGHQGTIGRIAWSPCGRFIVRHRRIRPSVSGTPKTENVFRCWKGTRTIFGRLLTLAKFSHQ
jgi:hypothetical protein